MKKHHLVRCFAVVLIIAPATLIYGGFLDNPRIFDDRYFRFSDMLSLELPILSPRFVTYWSFRLNGLLFGESLEAVRAVNVAIHATNALLVFAVARSVLAKIGGLKQQDAVLLAMSGALLFSLHPLGAFAVAYLIQRSILLSLMFALVAVACHLRGHEREDMRWMAMAAFAYFFSVFSKEHSVALPAILAAISFAFLRRTGRQWRWRYLLAFVAYGAIAVLVAGVVKQGVSGVYEPQAQMFMDLPENARMVSIGTQAVLYFKYLALWIVPLPQFLAIDLQHNLPLYVLPIWGTVGALCWLGLAGLVVLVLRIDDGSARLSALVVGWSLALFVTEFAGIRLSETFVLYRSYIWFVLLPTGLVYAVWRLISHWRPREATHVVAGLVLLMAMAFGVMLVQRLTIFSDEIAVWSEAVERNRGVTWPGAARAHSNLGGYLGYEQRYGEAFEHFSIAVRINPNHVNAWCNLATLYQLAHQPQDESMARAAARRLDPTHPCAQ